MSPPIKRARSTTALIRDELFKDEVINLVKLSLNKGSNSSQKLIEFGVDTLSFPFPVCIVRDLITDSNLLQSITHDVKNLEYNEKSNDLYQFKQSGDVSNLRNFLNIEKLYESIKTEGRLLVSKIFGDVDLKEDISATFSIYSRNDRLLCHDDKCGDRHIAFILYLVENWSEDDGGLLQIFSADSKGYPDKIEKSLCPQFNTLVLFEVTHTSFHQVSEVLTDTKVRLSFNGWFHVKEKKLISTECKPLDLELCFGTNEKHELNNHFSNDYLNENNILTVKNVFSASSEIQLDNFLVPNYWKQVQSDIQDNHIKWISKGPHNIRNYEVADVSTLPSSLKTLKNIFESKQWLEYLKSLTSLDFVPSANSNLTIWECGQLPACHCEIQKWSHSNYTLVHDKNPEFHREALDVVLRLPCETNDDGDVASDESVPGAGHIVYIDGESRDEECLLHVGYKYNSLALVYRDSKTLRFTKYLHSGTRPFYQVFCTFYHWKPPQDRPNLKHCDEDESSTDYSSDDSNKEDSVDSEV